MTSTREVAVRFNADSANHPITLAVIWPGTVATIDLSHDEAVRMLSELSKFLSAHEGI